MSGRRIVFTGARSYLSHTMEGMLYQNNLTLESCNAGISVDPKSSCTGTASTSRSPIPEKWVQVSGLRYYSPELGRWLSRDPIGEKSGRTIYSLGWNMPIGSFDVLGLLTSEDVEGVLAGVWISLRSSIAYSQTGFHGFLEKLEDANGGVADWFDGSPRYWPVLNWLRLPPPYMPDDTIHELVHAYNDIHLGMNNEYIGEGMAYTAESFYRAIKQLKLLEDMLKTTPCEGILTSHIRHQWRLAWFHADYTEIEAAYGNPDIAFNPEDVYAAQLGASYGLRLSCSRLAGIYNGVLRMRGCDLCAYFSRAAQSSNPGAMVVFRHLPIYVQ